jgi:hypothetical protein
MVRVAIDQLVQREEMKRARKGRRSDSALMCGAHQSPVRQIASQATVGESGLRLATAVLTGESGEPPNGVS